MKIPVFIHAQWDRYEKAFRYSCHNCDMTDYGYALIGKKEIEFQSPSDSALRNAASKSLRAQRNKVLAEAHVQAESLLKEAEELLSIEYKVASPAEEEIPF